MSGAQPARVLVDTSAWIDALRKDGDPEIRGAVRTLVAQGAAVFCDMVLLELWNGARGDEEADLLSELQRDLECVPITADTWLRAMELARACRTRGLTIPATDLLVAACAETHALSLLHHDAHFDLLARSGGTGKD